MSADEQAEGRVWWRLAGMMALSYAVQGAWWPLLAVHLRDLGVSERARGWIFATQAIACLATPLGAGHLADRRMPLQRLLAWIYALGAGLLVVLALGAPARAGIFFALFLAYWLITAPAFGLGNAMALRNLPRPQEQFGRVRLWGTVGWMAVGWLVSAVLAASGSTRAGQGTEEAFAVAAALAGLLAVYCLGLPHTPPLARDRRRRTHPWEALARLRRGPVAVYLIAAFGVSLTTPFVYQVIPAYLEARGLPRAWTASAMTLGQVLEILALAVLPWMVRRVGYRGTLAFGIAAWAVRFGSLVGDPPLWACIAGILLHGLGIACFTIGGQVYLDSRAPADLRASAQALNVIVTTGVGTLLGSLLAGEVASRTGEGAGAAFLLPCLICASLLAYFIQGFRPGRTATTPRDAAASSACLPVRDGARVAAVRLGDLGTESGDG